MFRGIMLVLLIALPAYGHAPPSSTLANRLACTSAREGVVWTVVDCIDSACATGGGTTSVAFVCRSGSYVIDTTGGSSGGSGTPDDNSVTSAKIVDGAIVDADVNASAAIASTKIGYTPTTASDYDDPDPTTAQGALDKLASVLTSLRAAWGGQQDVLVDLTNGINWVGIVPTTFTNPWEQLQSAVNPYLLDPTTPRVVRCVGRATADLADLRPIRYFNGTADVQANIDAGFVVAKASSIGVDGMPVINGSINGTGQYLTLISDGCQIEQDLTGQTRPNVLIYRGGTYFGGEAAGGTIAYFVSDAVDDRGIFTVKRIGASVDGGWTPGRPVVMDAANVFTSPTTSVGLWEDGHLRGNSAMSWRLHGIAGVDDDDIGILARMTWGRHWVGARVVNYGVGFQAYRNTVSSIVRGYIAVNGTNLVAGDPVNGCGMVYSSACGGLSCVSEGPTELCTQLAVTHRTVLEGALTGSQFVAYGIPRSWQFTDVHFESATTIDAHQILFGGGVCTGGDRANKSCGSDSECTGIGGGVCQSAVANNEDVTFDDLIVPSERGHPTFRGLYIGKGVGTNTVGLLTLRSPRLLPQQFGFDPGVAWRIAAFGVRRLSFPRRYPAFDNHPVQWCNWTFIADASGAVQTGGSNCALDSTVLPLEVNCMTTANGAVINVEHRARSTANSAGTDLLATDLTCGASLAVRTDGADPSVASIFSAESIDGSRVLTPTITSETLAAGDALRIAVKYVRER